jgi:hypothetical protein
MQISFEATCRGLLCVLQLWNCQMPAGSAGKKLFLKRKKKNFGGKSGQWILSWIDNKKLSYHWFRNYPCTIQ